MIALSSPVDDDLISEDKPRRSGHWSRKDLKIVLALLIVLVPLIVFVMVEQWKRGADLYCRLNVRAVAQAITGYSIDNDDRLPPTHKMDEDKGPYIVPQLGAPDTWATQVQPYMTNRQTFYCRCVGEGEGMKSVSLLSGVKTFDLSYGMYRGLSAVPRNQIDNPASAIMIAETTNRGHSKTFDPKLFGDDKPDCFLIGWDTDNLGFDKTTKWVTRLAFSNSDGPYGGVNLVGRHGDRVNAVTVDGGLRRLTAIEAKVEHAPPRLKGSWWADPNLFR